MKKKITSIDFYYFSGTGNTFLVVKKMKEVFETNGVTVNLYHLEKSPRIDVTHTIGVGFPVASQGTFPFVWNFVKSLPAAEGTPIFMVDTLLIYSGGVVGPMQKIVKEKGYTPIGAREIPMPNSLFPRKIDKEKNEKKVQKGLQRAEEYAYDILRGTSMWGRIPGLSDIMSVFSRSQLTWNVFRKLLYLKVDTSKCTQCNLCVQLCPVDTIEMKEYPEFKNTCEFCMKCISSCPVNAIYVPRIKFEVYRAAKIGID